MKIGREEAGYLSRGLSAWPLAVLVLVATLAMSLAYQFPLDWSYRLGKANQADHLYLRSFEPPDDNPNLSYRWSRQESYLRFEGAGRLPQVHLELEMLVGGRPANLGLPKVQLWETDYDRLLAEFEVKPDQTRYSFDFDVPGRKLDGDLRLTLKTLNPFPDKGHNNDLLGVVVTQVRLQGGPANGRPVIPNLTELAFGLVLLVAFYLALVRAGWRTGQAAGWGGLVALGLVIALAAFRFYLAPALDELALTTLLAYPLLVLGLRTTGGWLERRGEIAWPEGAARWLGLFFVTAFVIKAGGLNHPAFFPADHWFRIHQIERFWQQPAAFWQEYYNVRTGQAVTGLEGGSAVLGQWGLQLVLPYSPLFYLFAAPLALVWPQYHDPNLLIAVNDLGSWLEVSQIFLLYIIIRRAYPVAWSARAGVIAGAVWAYYPLSYLLFSDGGYNTIFASWLTLLFFALIFDWLRQREAGQPTGWLTAGLVITLAAALLAHTSTLLLLSATVFLSCVVLLIRRDSRALGRRLSLIGLGGLGLASLLYYGWYVPGLLTVTIPSFFGKLGTGIGQDNKLLGGQLLTGFWPQLWAHFRLWPFLLTILAFGFWLFVSRGQRSEVRDQENSDQESEVRGQEFITQNSKFKIQNSLFLCWLAVFLLFSLLDLKVNLLQKHMLFVAPLLCLGSGIALSLGWEWVKTQQKLAWRWGLGLLIGALVVFNLVQGLIVWYARVYYLVYPPGSG